MGSAYKEGRGYGIAITPCPNFVLGYFFLNFHIHRL